MGISYYGNFLKSWSELLTESVNCEEICVTRREYIPVGSTPARKRDRPASKLAVVQLRAKHALQTLASPMLATVSQISSQSPPC
jgi:hypothetical protein